MSERTVALYRSLDTLTLLALLPVIRQESERAKELLRREEELLNMVSESDVRLSEITAEALLNLENLKSQDPNIADEARELQEKMRTLRDDTLSNPESQRKRVMAVLEYSVEFLHRERWILGELRRRDLLPTFNDPSADN